ncbi:ENTH domain containing protein [Acanthamoeba castellanii str. Neff]|uniref:ENTH domain containing protein n=1 Tax=Acanthamoeba castellanii (strain ATCC 30010 / Neff) TaxID=1257118 RepID=L8GRW0_ACACF|nr:ENTH domain containing protein [Acanthamoeba castellanii str. Neff]ELR15368.1 ENTH domain containing protein [Acanthamoeba castellanii str. Neff]
MDSSVFHDGGSSSGEGDLVEELRTTTSTSTSTSPSPSGSKRPKSPLGFSPSSPSGSSQQQRAATRPGAAQPPTVPSAPKPTLKGRDAYRNGPRDFLLNHPQGGTTTSASGDLAPVPNLSTSPGSSPRVALSPCSPRTVSASPRSPRVIYRHNSQKSADDLIKAHPKQTATSPPPAEAEKSERTEGKRSSRGPALKHRSISSSRLVESSSSSLEPLSRRRLPSNEEPAIGSPSMAIPMHSTKSGEDSSTPERPKARSSKKSGFGSLSRASLRTSLRKGIWGSSEEARFTRHLWL